MSLGPNAIFASQMHQMPEVLEDFPVKVPFLDEFPIYRVPGNPLRTAATAAVRSARRPRAVVCSA